ncbi:DUF4402 domain-containing protein [Novosphingobium cyanobacteriorum]|uniref:DUF4402 domain-containing protein n=1 Tax=Novosphingobium cyanobacteriorum TaxID=3024215 RepID=A0ABT6CL19_9SPHN|nr:DUF4402 domain-containing protein [Novosphingobium cyanobacteriorum]MDF8334618.1 DUF4402 domain-containing protein [Novosphingobium cyanobacteriorum]
MRTIFAAMALVLLTAGQAQAGSGDRSTRSGSATARVVAPLVLVHNNGFVLRFGRFTAASAGTVTVPNTGAATTSGGVTFVTGSTTATDRFTAFGDPNRLIGITTGAGAVSAGSNAMTFTTVPMLPAGYIPFTGSGYFTVGGTLNVNAGQTPGSYTGSYTVNVTYN